jgi:hypothetical protein
MRKTSTLLPDGYGPLAAPEVGGGGYWTPPLAAGLGTWGDTTYLVVLHHRSFEPAYIREIPRSGVIEQVDAYLAEAAQAQANFNLLLCCAVEPHHYRDLAKFDGPCYTSPWLWVRYPHSVTSDAYNKNDYLANAWDKPHYYALGMATKLQEDLNLLQEFDREFRHLMTLNEAMQRLKQILMTRLPEDMARVVRIHHDLSF